MRSSTSLPGASIGKYRLIRHIADGGMGSVFRARDEQTGTVVAIKILSPELSSNPILVERFRREAIHAARLQHKNIVGIIEADESNGFHYLVMEYIEGVDLAEYIRRKVRLDPEEARRILIQACKALDHAFEQGITHRDIKPSNFLLANEEGRCRVKLTDLGLSRMTSEEDYRVTRAGTTVGTVDYMSPEQARDSSLADVRSDIYSLGCTLYHMLAGRPPFAEGGIGERVYKHMASDPPDVRTFNPAVPAGLWTVLRRMLAKHPDDRFQTPAELIHALRSISDLVVSADQEADADSSCEVDPAVEEMPTAAEAPLVEVEPPPPPPSTPPAVKATSPSASGRPKRKRPTTLPEMKTVADPAPSDPLGITADQRQAAVGQFNHATELMRNDGDPTYVQHMLLSCCRLDPTNTMYRKMLREVVRDHTAGKKAGWFGALTHYPARSRLRAAVRAGEWRKVLEHGEELLVKLPGDVPTQLDMAAAASALGLRGLATWMLEEARSGAANDVSVLRALAEVYAEDRRYNQAIAVLERLRQLVPDDNSFGARIRELAVSETLARGNYRR